MADPKYVSIGEPEDRFVEECAELIKCVQKAKRFGWMSNHPDRPTSNNYLEMQAEFQDVLTAYRDLVRKVVADHNLYDGGGI